MITRNYPARTGAEGDSFRMYGVNSEKRFDVDELVGLPRLSDMTVSPDGSRIVVCGERLEEEGRRYVTALYELDSAGERPPRRLTRSHEGETGATFAPDGSLLFSSARPKLGGDPGQPGADRPALWRLPAAGGEAHPMASPPGGVASFAVARQSGTVVFAAGMYPAAEGWDQDAQRESERRKADVEARLFEEYPVRYWDHYLGPREQRLLLAPVSRDAESAPEYSDLTPSPGRSLDDAEFDITPEGTAVVTTRWRAPPRDSQEHRCRR